MTQAEIALTVPDSVAADPEAIELVRFWWSKNEPVMAIKPAFEHPRSYGRMLAVMARNVAHVYATSRDLEEKEAYQEILAGLREALEGPAMQTVAEPKTRNA